jgi:hypothetical protein
MRIQQKQIPWRLMRSFKAQLDRYPDFENDMKSLSEFSTRKKIADFAGMILLIKDETKSSLVKLQRHKS